jgi:hypothetical protein
MTQEALKLALEAFHQIFNTTPVYYNDGTCIINDKSVELSNKATAAIKEALAQPEQEPVAWRTFDGEGGYDYRSYEDNESYADDWNKRNPNHVGWVDELYTHSPQPEQEPIYQYQMANGSWIDQTKESHDYNVRHGQATVRVVHTAPPQRTWVGLTDGQIDACWNKDLWKEKQPHHIFAKAIESKLKEVNT